MAGRYQKQSLNPRVAFYGDIRFTSNRHNNTGLNKVRSARKAFAIEWPDKEWPNFAGSAYYVYELLKEAGWVYSTRYGWRKNGKTPEEMIGQ